MNNWNIIGHEWAVTLLRRSIQNGRVAHAYLLSGPASIGKQVLALRMAQALICERADGDPCGECRTCRRVERGNHPDVRIAGMATQAQGLKPDEAVRQKDLKIDTVREWQGDITRLPYEAPRRILILHDAERLTESAANAMLKTLEEPPAYAVLILVASTTSDLMPTIVSRCRLLRLRPVPRRTIADALRERYRLVPDEADLLAGWSGGRIGWALHMVQNPDALQSYQEQLDELIDLRVRSRADQFAWAEERAKEYRGGEQERAFAALELWQRWQRDVLLVAAGRGDAIVFSDRQAALQQAATRTSLTALHAFLKRLELAARQLRENTNPQVVFENLLLHAP